MSLIFLCVASLFCDGVSTLVCPVLNYRYPLDLVHWLSPTVQVFSFLFTEDEHQIFTVG